jgi:hypothetical protein
MPYSSGVGLDRRSELDLVKEAGLGYLNVFTMSTARLGPAGRRRDRPQRDTAR